MNELYIDEPAMEDEGNCAKYIQLIQSCLYTLLEYNVLVLISAHADWISFIWRNLFLRAHLHTTPSSVILSYENSSRVTIRLH